MPETDKKTTKKKTAKKTTKRKTAKKKQVPAKAKPPRAEKVARDRPLFLELFDRNEANLAAATEAERTGLHLRWDEIAQICELKEVAESAERQRKELGDAVERHLSNSDDPFDRKKAGKKGYPKFSHIDDARYMRSTPRIKDNVLYWIHFVEDVSVSRHREEVLGVEEGFGWVESQFAVNTYELEAGFGQSCTVNAGVIPDLPADLIVSGDSRFKDWHNLSNTVKNELGANFDLSADG